MSESTDTSATPVRQTTPIDRIANDYVDRIAALDPIDATYMGVKGHDHQMTDFSPGAVAERVQAGKDVLAKIDREKIQDEIDAVTVAAMHERLELQTKLHEAGELDGELNNIASPLQSIREVFDVTASTTTNDWEVIALRIHAVPDAVDSYIESLRAAAGRGKVPALRQVELGIKQADELAGPESIWSSYVAGARPDGVEPTAALATALGRDADLARAAYGRLAEFMRAELAPKAPTSDAFGRDRYALWSQYFIGAKIDLEETYQWGIEELARVVAEQEATAALIAGPGASVEDAVAVLDADASLQLHGTDALQKWMQTTADQAIADLSGTHFDIPEPVRTIECCIAPTQSGGIYYTGPSEDFTRPGRMWWSVPAGVEDFATWREKTTVYHEGVPGHHLQIGQTVFRSALLNRWRRLGCFTSGHAEGWALYAERLMDELGYLNTPADRLGMLDGQRMRAARVVFDIGVHLSLPCPEAWGGGTWDAEKAHAFLSANVNMPPEFIRFEADRYLGWAGQAPSYKVGQRLWEQARDTAAAGARARGEEFSLKDFHRRALDLGSVGLDTLRDALA